MSKQIDVQVLHEGMRRFGAAVAAFVKAAADAGLKPAASTPAKPAETRLWRFAIRVPEGREGELTKLINESGAEVYRAWPVGEQQ